MTSRHSPSPFRLQLTRYLLVALVLTVVLAPLSTIDIPPLVDFPNHLARQYILADLRSGGELQRFYVADWYATPYLALDGIVQTLSHVMSVLAASKVFVALLLMLFAAAPFALGMAIDGRASWAAVVGLLFVHNTTLELGFVPYLFSLGYGLCLLALWIRSRHGPLWMRLGLQPVLAASLFFCHLIGFALYILCVVAYELGRHVDSDRRQVPRSGLGLDPEQRTNVASLLLQCGIPLAIFALFGPASETGSALQQTTHGGLGRKLEFLVGMVSYLMPPYLWSIDRAVAIGLPIAIALLLVTGKLKYSRALLWPLAAVSVLYFAMPMQWLGGWGGDHRLLPAIGILIVAGLYPADRAWPAWRLVVPIVVALVLVRVATVTIEWRAADREAAAFTRSFESIPEGRKIYYAFGHAGGRNSSRPKYFLACLAASGRKAFVPYLFTSETIPGIPLRYRPEFASLQLRSPGPILTQRASPNWQAIGDAYDYFIIANEQHFDQPVPAHWIPIHVGQGFKIYIGGAR
jgi:hypothetical protein